MYAIFADLILAGVVFAWMMLGTRNAQTAA